MPPLPRRTLHWLTTATLGLWACAAHAHEGHGLQGGSHWHASDLWGFVAVAAIVAAAVWRGRK